MSLRPPASLRGTLRVAKMAELREALRAGLGVRFSGCLGMRFSGVQALNFNDWPRPKHHRGLYRADG
jgi:hypothetical protein